MLSWDSKNYCRITDANFKTLFWFFNRNFFAFVEDLNQYYELKTFVACEDDPMEHIYEPMGSTTSQGWPYDIFRVQENNDGSIDSIYMFHGVFDLFPVSSVHTTNFLNKTTLVYPNPGTGTMLQVESTRSSVVDYTMYDMSGRVVFFAVGQNLSIGGNETHLNKEMLAGNYLLSIRFREGHSEWHKVIRN